MSPQAASHLLNSRGAYIRLPTLRLHRHSNSHNISHYQGPAYVHTSITAKRGHLDINKSHLDEQRCNELLKFGRTSFLGLIQHLSANDAVPFFNHRADADRTLSRKPDHSS